LGRLQALLSTFRKARQEQTLSYFALLLAKGSWQAFFIISGAEALHSGSALDKAGKVCQEQSGVFALRVSDEEKMLQRRLQTNIGRVVWAENTDKKSKGKETWFPALIVAPSASDTVKIDTKEEFLIRFQSYKTFVSSTLNHPAK
jgi:hypothetical protein